MRHTRNRQMYLAGKPCKYRNFKMSRMRKNSLSLDPTFKWHSEAVSSNFWSNFRKSCVSFDYKSSHPNAIGMATKYLPTKERK